MALSFDLANSNNWTFRYSADVDAEPSVVPGNFKPIPDQVIPILLNSPIVAIRAESSSAKSRWKTAGWAFQKVQVGIVGNPFADTLVQRRHRFYLDKLTLLILDDFQTSYGLTLAIPYWMKQISFIIWEFTGSITDIVDVKLDQIIANTEAGGGN